MAKIENGFPGERLIVLPLAFLELIKDDPLTNDLFLHSMGHIAHAKHHRIERPEGLSEYMFLYCTWGRGSVKVRNEEFTLSANQFIVLPAGVPCVYGADNDDPWTIYWMAFSGSKAHIYAKAMNKVGAAPPSVYSRIEQRTELFESIYSMLCGGASIDKLNFANIQMANFLASFMYKELLADTPANTSVTTDHIHSMVNKVTHFMSENIERRLTLKQIANYAGYSESYFYRRFIKETGYSPIDYFIHMKMNKASIYLIKTSLSVNQIAAKLGFNSPDFFSRTFKRIIGISASEFRKQNFRL